MRPALPTASFDDLREAGRQAVEAGRLHEALGLFDEALRAARHEGDPERIDLAVCNRSAVAITLGEGDGELARLRAILLRNAHPEACFAAAYNLSRYYELTKAFKKGLFYGRIARDRARMLRRGEYLAKSHNQIGNCLLAESYFDEAVAEYQSALDQLGLADSVEFATVLINLGYCRTMLGDPREGFRLAFRALRSLRRVGAHLYEAWPHLDLCYAYLEIGRLERARRHGQHALALAEKTGHRDLLKNALFLLGEVEQAEGRSDAAYGHFQRLQSEFYPESPRLANLMLVVDMRRMINLRA
ncbi:MAG: tetratricopeptide repeat protein [Thermoanaerobaculia bacterium]|nr:tetratricopeptide repeat protein [Thermoanaerobaculia bacterium]